MPNLFSRTSLNVVLLALSASCFACGGDQKQPNSAEGVAPVSTGALPGPEEVTSPPNGQPTELPPANPAPQSLNEPARGNTVASTQASAAPARAASLSQAQIAQVTELANSGEIEQAKIAQTKAKSASVKQFAAMMIKHHGEAKSEQAKLYKKLDLTPTSSETANLLQADSDKALGKLRAADGAAFDQAYIQGQVEAHQKVLDTIDRELLPAATDQALVSELNKMRATVEAHLAEAKRLAAQLSKTPG